MTIETNLLCTYFLDIHFNLKEETYKPYRPSYINIESNHPHSIIKQLPKKIVERIFKLSSSAEVFNKEIPVLPEAVRKLSIRRN